MVPLVLFLAGVVLCISRHPVWGVLCFFFALCCLVFA